MAKIAIQVLSMPNYSPYPKLQVPKTLPPSIILIIQGKTKDIKQKLKEGNEKKAKTTKRKQKQKVGNNNSQSMEKAKRKQRNSQSKKR